MNPKDVWYYLNRYFEGKIMECDEEGKFRLVNPRDIGRLFRRTRLENSKGFILSPFTELEEIKQ
jgi:hypothetical protein